jgi:hypothetical protein
MRRATATMPSPGARSTDRPPQAATRTHAGARSTSQAARALRNATAFASRIPASGVALRRGTSRFMSVRSRTLPQQFEKMWFRHVRNGAFWEPEFDSGPPRPCETARFRTRSAALRNRAFSRPDPREVPAPVEITRASGASRNHACIRRWSPASQPCCSLSRRRRRRGSPPRRRGRRALSSS